MTKRAVTKEPTLWGVAISKWPVDELQALPWYAAMLEKDADAVRKAIQQRIFHLDTPPTEG